MNEHEKWIEYAVRLSAEGMRGKHGGPFGAVIVKGGKAVGIGYNKVTSECDPTAHAEIVAIREACRTLGTFTLEGCEIYSSCEPCPMCLGAIYWAKLDKLYYANTRHDAADAGFSDDFIYSELGLPHGQRSIPSQHIDFPGAKEVFAEWLRMPDKILY
ncbi:MAG: nucleoside deaminase [Chitinophagales bacterium]|nr:nucleoside deaminase [Chitinophagales bacterium]